MYSSLVRVLKNIWAQEEEDNFEELDTIEQLSHDVANSPFVHDSSSCDTNLQQED